MRYSRPQPSAPGYTLPMVRVEVTPLRCLWPPLVSLIFVGLCRIILRVATGTCYASGVLCGQRWRLPLYTVVTPPPRSLVRHPISKISAKIPLQDFFGQCQHTDWIGLCWAILGRPVGTCGDHLWGQCAVAARGG